jgi:hypothetical protein
MAKVLLKKIAGKPRHSIAEDVGKQRRGAVQGAGFAIGHGLGFGIQQLAIDHPSQHVVAEEVSDEDSLEAVVRFIRTVGSNPTLSANGLWSC